MVVLSYLFDSCNKGNVQKIRVGNSCCNAVGFSLFLRGKKKGRNCRKKYSFQIHSVEASKQAISVFFPYLKLVHFVYLLCGGLKEVLICSFPPKFICWFLSNVG